MEKGIPSIVTAACSLDDVFAIAGFGITLGFAFPSNENASLTWKILKAPVEVIIGITIGTAFGLIVTYFPDPESDRVLKDTSENPDDGNEIGDSALEERVSRNNSIRLLLLVFGGFAFIFASTQLEFSGSGPLGVLVLAAVAGYRFREYPHICDSLVGNLDKLWSFLAVFLFSLIGADVKVTNIDGNIVLSIVAVLLIGLLLRMVTTYCCLFSGGLNFKEKVFICIGWVSKAAVQAAVGPVALTIARSRCIEEDCNEDNDVIWAKIILTTSVFAVLISAPLGALGMAFTAKRFLSLSPLTISTCPPINPPVNLDKVRQVAISLTNDAHAVSEGARRSV